MVAVVSLPTGGHAAVRHGHRPVPEDALESSPGLHGQPHGRGGCPPQQHRLPWGEWRVWSFEYHCNYLEYVFHQWKCHKGIFKLTLFVLLFLISFLPLMLLSTSWSIYQCLSFSSVIFLSSFCTNTTSSSVLVLLLVLLLFVLLFLSFFGLFLCFSFDFRLLLL